MERQRIQNKDGSEEAVIARTEPFAIDKFAVPNTNFRKFIKETGYVTDAEKYGWSFVVRRPPAGARSLPTRRC